MKIDVDVRNTSLIGNTHEIKRILNSIPEMGELDNNNFFRQVLQRCAPLSAEAYPCSMLSKDEIQALISKYEESNRRVLNEYVKEDWDSLFDNTTPDLPKWEKENPYMQDDIIRFVGMSAAFLLKENRKIREENRKAIKALEYKLSHPIRAVIGEIGRAHV